MKIVNGNFVNGNLPFRTVTCQGWQEVVKEIGCMRLNEKGKRQLRQDFATVSFRLRLQAKPSVCVQRAMLICLRKHTKRTYESLR